MKRASRFLSDHEKTRIEEAVTAAEEKTSAEIVPALATGSGRYDRAEDVFGLWTGLFSMVVAWLLLQGQGVGEAQWGSSWSRFELPILVLAVLVGFMLGSLASTLFGWGRRAFTPRKQMREEVKAAANRIFHDQRIHRTQGATGLLIYVSLFERMASVVADQTVLDKLGQSALDGLCKQLTDGIQAGDAATAFCEVIASAGEALGAVLPRADDDRDELPNALIILD